LRKAKASVPLLACGLDDGKARQAAALQNVCAGAAACGRIKIGTAGWNYDARNKKGGREAAALGKTRTLT
jgi:hypothetical protein